MSVTMKSLRQAIVLSTVLLFCFAGDKPAFQKWVSPDHFDFHAMLGNPPADDSPEHKAEVDQMLDLQAKRTKDEESRCKSEEDVTAFAFADVLGDWFNEKNLPFTATLMKAAKAQTDAVSSAAKKEWNRTRPSLADPRIHICVRMEKSSSYPSGHATRGMMWATVLSQMFPDQKDKLMARGRQIGTDRYLAGIHYPSDVAAGQKLGTAVGEQLLKDDDFKAQLEKAKEECLAVHH